MSAFSVLHLPAESGCVWHRLGSHVVAAKGTRGACGGGVSERSLEERPRRGVNWDRQDPLCRDVFRCPGYATTTGRVFPDHLITYFYDDRPGLP